LRQDGKQNGKPCELRVRIADVRRCVCAMQQPVVGTAQTGGYDSGAGSFRRAARRDFSC